MRLQAKSMKIMQRRIEKGWDKISLAREANINQSLISRIESGGRTSPATAKAIADALEVAVFEIFELLEHQGVGA